MKRTRRKWSLLLIVCLLVGSFPNAVDRQSGNDMAKEKTVAVPAVRHLEPAPVVDPVDTTSYSLSFEVKKDDATWNGSGKEYALCPQGETVSKWTLATDGRNNYDRTDEAKTDGIIRVKNGYYDIYEVLETDTEGYVTSYKDTGLEVIVSSSFVSSSFEVRTLAIDYYTVSFYDGADKLAIPQEQIVLKGTKAEEPSKTPQKQNYEFVKWVSGESSDAKFDFANTAIDASTKVYASWKQMDGKYKEEYYLQNAEDDEYPQNPVSSEEMSGKAGNKVSITQKQFSGFTLVPVEEENLPSISSTETVVAKYFYMRNQYSLTWNANGGEIQDTAYTTGQVKFGAAIEAPMNLTKEGYVFDGWDATPVETMPADALVYTAQWAPVQTAPPTKEPTAPSTEVPAPTTVPSAVPTVMPSTAPTTAPAVSSGKELSGNKVNVMHGQIIPKEDGIQKLTWEKVKDADGYIIYYASCSSKLRKLTTIKDGTVTSYIKKNCKDNQFYKYQVKAYKLVKGKKKIVAKGWVCHGINVNQDSKYTNVKEVKVKETSITIRVGEKRKFNKKDVTFVKKEKGKILASEKHCARIRLQSSDRSIASVKKGKIIGKKAGKCILYVIAPSGKCVKVKITVKE